MYYFISSIVFIGLILFIEYKKRKYFSKFKGSYSLIDSIKNDFSVVKFISISFLFVSLVMIFIIKLERGGFISFIQEEFKFEYIFYILFSGFIIPIIEEYFYRFLPYSFKKINSKVNYILIVLVSSFMFACFHNINLLMSVIVFIMAIIFSIIYLKTRNISYSIGCHSIYNFVTLFRTYTGYSNLGVFMILSLVCLLVLFYYNDKKNFKKIK